MVIKGFIPFAFLAFINVSFCQIKVEMSSSLLFKESYPHILNCYTYDLSSNSQLDSFYINGLKQFNVEPKKINFLFKTSKLQNKVKIEVYRSNCANQKDTTLTLNLFDSSMVILDVVTNYTPIKIPVEFKYLNANQICLTPKLLRKISIIEKNKCDSFIINFPLISEIKILYLNDINSRTHYLNEFINLKNKYVSFKKFDLFDNNSEIEIKNLNEKIIGNQISNYVPDSIYTILNNLESQKTLSREYFLLNFYGYWCEPCRNHLNELIKLEKKLINNNRFTMINIQCQIDRYKIEDEIYKESSKLKFVNNKVEPIITKNKSGLIKFFNIWKYPTFIIVDKNGKIINRDVKNIEEVYKYLKL